MKALTIAAVLPAARLLIDTVDAAVELAGAVRTSFGAAGWDFGLDVEPLTLGLGVVIERSVPGTTSTALGRPSATLVIGPLILTAVGPRAELMPDCSLSVPPEQTANAAATLPAPSIGDFDCCHGSGLADYAAVPCPNPTCSAVPERMRESEHASDEPVEQPEYRPYRSVSITCSGCGARLITQPDPRGLVVDVGGCKEPTFYDGPPFMDENGRVHA